MNSAENEIHSLFEWQEKTKFTLIESIDKAIANKELSHADAEDVLVMREALFT